MYDEYEDEYEEEDFYSQQNNDALNCVIDMINEHENVNLNLDTIKEIKINDLKPNLYILLCHKCIYYDVPGVVDMFCYGLKDYDNNYYYMFTSLYLGR